VQRPHYEERDFTSQQREDWVGVEVEDEYWEEEEVQATPPECPH
jgi:hypothetical protein